jgi:hypothetical protein
MKNDDQDDEDEDDFGLGKIDSCSLTNAWVCSGYHSASL